jgi:hypothetical protein
MKLKKKIYSFRLTYHRVEGKDFDMIINTSYEGRLSVYYHGWKYLYDDDHITFLTFFCEVATNLS